ncbi:KTSC domain-containing protein [Legionella saoudiensis]|uniref:KTSC domain-containing protein n=1 Tax=Legionella saoudiensis TaxID=1750561 RepID=UPI00098F594D
MVAWIQLQSSVISAAAYQGSTLYLRFLSNREYAYYNVPRNIYEELISASSVGHYFNINIKDHYRYKRIT